MSERLPFEFTGFADEQSVSLNVDPSEYKGLSAIAISKELLKACRSINPKLSFFPADFDMAAEAIIDALRN
jgi:hypothetical protein